MTDSRYTDEVMVAMRARGMVESPIPAPPAGQLRYHVAVEETLLNGIAPAATVATILRNLADLLDPSTP